MFKVNRIAGDFSVSLAIFYLPQIADIFMVWLYFQLRIKIYTFCVADKGYIFVGDWVWTFEFFVEVCIKGDLVLVLYWSISYNKENIFLFFSVNVILLFCNSLSCKKVARLGCDIPTVCYMQQTWSLPHYIKITRPGVVVVLSVLIDQSVPQLFVFVLPSLGINFWGIAC